MGLPIMSTGMYGRNPPFPRLEFRKEYRPGILIRGNPRVKGGEKEVNALLKADEKAEVKRKVKDHLKAPLKKGQKVGEIQYLLEGKEIASFDVVTDRKVEKRSVLWCLNQALQRVCL